MTSFRKALPHGQNGFTLVELLLVLALIGIVLAAGFQFLFFTHNSYARADSRSAVIQEVNLFFNQIERDIRSASEPNNATKSVRILDSGNSLDIYRFNNTANLYERISYRLHPDDSTKLQRGVASSAVQISTANPNYAVIPDSGDGAWKDMVSDVLSISFSDRNPGDTIGSRRLVDIDISVKPSALKNSIAMQTAIMSRTGKSTTSIAAVAAETQYVPVTGIVITPASWTLGRAAATQTFTATVVPANATNKTLIWSQDLTSDLGYIELPFWPYTRFDFFDPFIAFSGYSLNYDDGTSEWLEDTDLTLDGYRDKLVIRSGSPVKINVSEHPVPKSILGTTINYTREATIRVRLASPAADDFSGSVSMTIRQSNH